MKFTLSTAMAAAILIAVPACKQQEAGSNAPAAEAEAASLEALNGTWTVDLASLKFEGKPDELLLKDGIYSCSSCIPPLTNFVADGAMHPVTDRPYFDSMSVKAVDDKTIEVHRAKAGKEVLTMTQSVSADGNVLTSKFKDTGTPGQTIEGQGTAQRTGPAPAGAHAVSGQWKQDRIGDYSKDALDIVYSIAGNTVTSSSQGQSYSAEIGGPAVAIQGDTGGTMVAVSRDGAGLKETYTRDGKEVSVVTITPSADGKSFSLVNADSRDGSKVSLTANKKS